MNCTFTGRTLIRARKTENAKEDSETLREVMKLCGHIEAKDFAVMMGCASTEIANWWHHDDDGTPRFQHLEKSSLLNVYVDYYVSVDGVEFEGCKLDKFSFTVKRNRRAYLEFELIIPNLQPDQKMHIDECQKHGINDFTVRSDQADLVEAAA
jgi:hypothetical protein